MFSQLQFSQLDMTIGELTEETNCKVPCVYYKYEMISKIDMSMKEERDGKICQ